MTRVDKIIMASWKTRQQHATTQGRVNFCSNYTVANAKREQQEYIR